jgi:hypothetical protein
VSLQGHNLQPKIIIDTDMHCQTEQFSHDP